MNCINHNKEGIVVQRKLKGRQWSERIIKEIGCIMVNEPGSIFASTCGNLVTFSRTAFPDKELAFHELVSGLVGHGLMPSPLSGEDSKRAIRIISIMVG